MGWHGRRSHLSDTPTITGTIRAACPLEAQAFLTRTFRASMMKFLFRELVVKAPVEGKRRRPCGFSR